MDCLMNHYLGSEYSLNRDLNKSDTFEQTELNKHADENGAHACQSGKSFYNYRSIETQDALIILSKRNFLKNNIFMFIVYVFMLFLILISVLSMKKSSPHDISRSSEKFLRVCQRDYFFFKNTKFWYFRTLL